MEGSSLFHISTIHSFCWLQIKSFHDDIRLWLQKSLAVEIEQLRKEQDKGRANTKTAVEREKKILSRSERLAWLAERREFTYNPNGENIGKSSLSHTEVLKICADFLVSKPSFQQIVITSYPFILIDESQDTNKNLIEALFTLEAQHQGRFGLGLIGDMMQRIYGDGKADLGVHIPEWWEKPIKQMNHRCPSRIVKLANAIRSENSQHHQKFIEGNGDGTIRFFIAPIHADRSSFEVLVKSSMWELTGDAFWSDDREVKHLMLEHKMAATRMNFSAMWDALAASKHLTTRLYKGELPALKLFSEAVLPLYQFQKAGNSLAVMAHLRSVKCPLLTPDFLKQNINLTNPLTPVKDAVHELVELISTKPGVSFKEVLDCIVRHGLFVWSISFRSYRKLP